MSQRDAKCNLLLWEVTLRDRGKGSATWSYAHQQRATATRGPNLRRNDVRSPSSEYIDRGHQLPSHNAKATSVDAIVMEGEGVASIHEIMVEEVESHGGIILTRPHPGIAQECGERMTNGRRIQSPNAHGPCRAFSGKVEVQVIGNLSVSWHAGSFQKVQRGTRWPPPPVVARPTRALSD